MTFHSHSDRKYGPTTRLLDSFHFANLHVERRLLEAGHQEPGVCEANELAFVLSGRTFTSRTGNGLTQRAFIQPGLSCICPIGVHESASGITSPIETLHIYMPQTLIAHSAIADYDIDPSKVELAYAGGLTDPVLYQIAMGFHGALSRPPEPTDRLFLAGMQAALAGHLLGNYAIDRWKPPVRAPELDPRRLNRVLAYIEANLAGEIALDDLAAEACLSEFHFSRLFREATGLSPSRYVTYRRVQEAQRQLEEDRASMVEIALETGFGTQANFIRVFRKATGLTPGQYRSLRRQRLN